MRRGNQQDLTLTIEHRASRAPEPFDLELAQSGDGLALRPRLVNVPTGSKKSSLDERITQALESAGHPMSATEPRELCASRNETVLKRLAVMTKAGLLLYGGRDGYRLASLPT